MCCVDRGWVGGPGGETALSVLDKHHRNKMRQRSIESVICEKLFAAPVVISDGVHSPRPISMRYRCLRQFHFVPADVATEEDCSRLASEADRLMGCVDGLVSISSAAKLCSVLCDSAVACDKSFRVANGRNAAITRRVSQIHHI